MEGGGFLHATDLKQGILHFSTCILFPFTPGAGGGKGQWELLGETQAGLGKEPGLEPEPEPEPEPDCGEGKSG